MSKKNTKSAKKISVVYKVGNMLNFRRMGWEKQWYREGKLHKPLMLMAAKMSMVV